MVPSHGQRTFYYPLLVKRASLTANRVKGTNSGNTVVRGTFKEIPEEPFHKIVIYVVLLAV